MWPGSVQVSTRHSLALCPSPFARCRSFASWPLSEGRRPESLLKFGSSPPRSEPHPITRVAFYYLRAWLMKGTISETPHKSRVMHLSWQITIELHPSHWRPIWLFQYYLKHAFYLQRSRSKWFPNVGWLTASNGRKFTWTSCCHRAQRWYIKARPHPVRKLPKSL